MLALGLSYFKIQKCKTAQEIMSLLLTSTRTYQDLTLINEYYLEGEDYPDMKFALRRWDDDLDFSREYRCYIYNNRFNAISKHPITPNEEQFKEDFLNEFKHKAFVFWKDNIRESMIKLEHYTMDLAMHSDGNLNLVEFNPFDSSGTFEFEKDPDYKNIIEGAHFNPEVDEEKQIIVNVYKGIRHDIEKIFKESIEEIHEHENDQAYDVILNEFLDETQEDL